MHRPYLLALDLGTASLGHVAFALDEAGTELRGILDLGVAGFPRWPQAQDRRAFGRAAAPAFRDTLAGDTPGIPHCQNESLTFGYKAAVQSSIHYFSTIGGDFFGGFACFH